MKLHSLLLCFALSAASAPFAGAQAYVPRTTADIMHPDEPTHLIVGYRCKASNRAAFISYLKGKEAAQLDKWKQEGVILSYEVLEMGITHFNDDVDAVITLEFPSYVGTYKWVDIEKTMPGGLSAEGLKLGSPKWSVLADRIAHAETAERHPADAAYEVSQYEFEDEAGYKNFAINYPAKMFANWMKQGAVTMYSIYESQNVEGAPWDSFIVLEYKDRNTYSHSAQVKIRGYSQLASDKDWLAAEKIHVAAKHKTHECFYTSVASSAK